MTGRFFKNHRRRVTQSIRLAIEWQGTESATAISEPGMCLFFCKTLFLFWQLCGHVLLLRIPLAASQMSSEPNPMPNSLQSVTLGSVPEDDL